MKKEKRMNCPKIDDCYKVRMVLDKACDVPELYAICIRETCGNWCEREHGILSPV